MTYTNNYGAAEICETSLFPKKHNKVIIIMLHTEAQISKRARRVFGNSKTQGRSYLGTLFVRL
jgi:hypothetical protein